MERELSVNRQELEKLLAESKAKVDAMSPEEREHMIKGQILSVAKAEASWPKPKYKWVDGAKVYESMEDYYND